MKKLWFYFVALAVIFLGTPLAAEAQGGFTTVIGTITDPNGVPWACGTISAQLITAGGAAPTLNGGGFTTQTSPVSLGCPTTPGTGASGSFTMRLADSGVIVPSNTTWKFIVNINGGAPPLGTGPQSFTYTTAINCSTNTPATCTSNQINISTPISALAPLLGNGVTVPAISTQAPVSCVASPTFTVSATFLTDFFVNLSCNVTSSTIAGPFVTGSEAVFTLTQDATGGRSFTFPPSFVNTPTVGQAAGATTVATFQYCGAAGNGNACPAGSWQNTDVGPLAPGATPGGPLYINASAFGASCDVKTCEDGTVTNGSPNISSAGGCQFTAADVGKKIFVTNICNSGQCGFINSNSSITILPTQLTVARIGTFTDATHVVADCTAPGTCGSPNATATNTGFATILYGTDQTAKLNNAFNSAGNMPSCPALVLPQGICFFNLPLFTPLPSAATNNCSGNGFKNISQINNFLDGGGPAIVGQGQMASILTPTPDFTNPGAAASCIAGYTNSTFMNFMVSGFGQSLLGAGFSPCGNLFGGNTSQMMNVSLEEWGSSTASSVGLNLANGFSELTNVSVYAFGGTTPCAVNGTDNTFSQVTCGLAAGVSGFSAMQLLGGATLQSSDSTFVMGSTQNSPQIDVCNGCIWQSSNDLLFGQAANSAPSDDIKIENGGIAQITNMLNTHLGANSNGIEVIAGGELSLSQYRVQSGTAQNKSLANAGTFRDVGQNVFNGPVTSTGTILGSPSITGTACATGNWALTSGWGTSSITSVTAGGDSHRCQVVITGAAGAASPVLTWTFPKAYFAAPGSCQISFNGTLTGESTAAPTATSVAFTFTGTPSAQTYRLDASCGP